MALVKCAECGKQISSLAPACPSCGAPRSAGDSKTNTVVIYERPSSAGMMTGIFGSIFAILGIFTFGLLFIPFAMLFSFISLLSSILRPNGMGLMWAILSCILTVLAFVMSPTAWLAALAIFGRATSP